MTEATEVKVTEFQTKDMNLAACLLHDSVRYIRTERDESDSRRLIFVFEFSPEIERIKEQRANSTHIVSSTLYDDCLRKLKTIIHS